MPTALAERMTTAAVPQAARTVPQKSAREAAGGQWGGGTKWDREDKRGARRGGLHAGERNAAGGAGARAPGRVLEHAARE